MEMYLQVKTIKLVPNQYGNNVEISKVGLYDEAGNWVKWIKLDESILTALTNIKIPFYGGK